jgi:hypothetical protein
MSKHIFISYSRGNLDTVQRITTELLNAGINVWIDKVGLKPGTPDWEQALRDAIHNAEMVLFMASPTARRSTYVRDELAIADMERVPVYPVWVEGEHWMDCVPMGRGYVQFIDVRGSAYLNGLQQIANALTHKVVKFETQETPVAPEPIEVDAVDNSRPPRNPYKGLRAFRAEDAADFFGRDTLIEELLVKLGNGVKPPRLLTVLGASGSGKSSVVMAGLLPRLRKGAIKGSDNWLYLDLIVPGSHPLESLTIALWRQMKEMSQTAIREDLMNHNKRGLYTLTSGMSDKPVVLYIDQFEELFTLVNDEAERRQFIDLLTTAITEPNGMLTIILSMRADFYDRPMQYAELGSLIENHHVAVKPMSLADLYDVVQKPAQLSGLTFDDGLVTEIVFAVREEVGTLPLLQFTLDQLFEKRDGRTLTVQAYEQMGGVQGALAQHAEATYNSLPSAQHKTLARALFLRLIEAGATEQDTTRRRATNSELTLADVEATHILQGTTNTFVDARLLVSDKSGTERTVEVSHETLIREWQRFSEWLHEAREDLRLQKSLAADVAEWKRRGEPDDMLYRGTVLERAVNWLAGNIASVDETNFIQAGVIFAGQLELIEKARKQREEATALRAQTFRKRTLQFRRASVVLGVIFVLTALAGISAWRVALQAQEEGNVASTRIAELGNIAPGATEGASWHEWVSTLNVETKLEVVLSGAPVAITSNVEWIAFDRTFNNVKMVFVPAGCFMFGREHDWIDDRPVDEVCFNTPFWIDRYEVTNAQFEAFNGEAATVANWSEPDQPRTAVLWYEAQNFCRLREARLPTQTEWEYAARGPSSYMYPWGNESVEDTLVALGDAPTIVGSREWDVSWVGAFDMSGNAAEWTNPIIDPAKIITSGPLSGGIIGGAGGVRYWLDPNLIVMHDGFRCIRPW